MVLVAGVGARHQSGDGGAARLSHRDGARARGRHGRSGGGDEAAVARCRRHHADQPQHLRPVRARRGGDRRRRARGRRLLLCRRRQLQRHRRQGAARRSRRRCHAHQPAQDVLDAAWRRRAGRGAGGACRRRWRRSCRCRTRCIDGDGVALCGARRGRCGEAAKPLGRMCAFHGQMGMFVRALAYMLSHGTDGMRQASEDAVLNANYVRAGLSDLMSLPFGDRPCMHEVLFDDRWLRGHRRHHARLRQGDDRRGLPPDDGVLPAGRARRHADRADRVGIQAEPRSVRRARCAGWPRPPRRGDVARFKDAPRFAPRRRLDETKAAREPKLRWAPAVSRQRRPSSWIFVADVVWDRSFELCWRVRAGDELSAESCDGASAALLGRGDGSRVASLEGALRGVWFAAFNLGPGRPSLESGGQSAPPVAMPDLTRATWHRVERQA